MENRDMQKDERVNLENLMFFLDHAGEFMKLVSDGLLAYGHETYGSDIAFRSKKMKQQLDRIKLLSEKDIIRRAALTANTDYKEGYHDGSEEAIEYGYENPLRELRDALKSLDEKKED
ncbi:MAG: hypothetical protein LUE89_09540 [Clostridiales bacterium]|nr:hypothetical protein [Clostridiales bacterium]